MRHTDQPQKQWEVECGDAAISVSYFAVSVDDLLDYCGRLLYGHDLFEVHFMRIRQVEPNQPESLGDTYSRRDDKRPEWIMHTLGADGKVGCRQLEWRHELFAMIIAELGMGASVIEVRHITNAVAEK